MKSRQLWKISALILGCSAAWQLPPSAGILSAGESGAPDAAARAKGLEASNLARLTAGASLAVQAPGTTAPAADDLASNALLRDDDPLGYPLAQGSTSLIVTLPKIEVLNRFNFLNLTAKGKVTIAISSASLPPESPRWRAVQAMDFAGDNGVVTCDLGSVEAKYVRVSFDVPAQGRIDTFGLYGQPTLGETFSRRGLPARSGGDSDTRYVLYNYAVDSPHAGVVLVSPGEDLDQAQQMADGDVGTSYTFQPGDPAPMAVIDLGESRSLTRVGASFQAGPGHLAIYLLADPQLREGLGAGKAAFGKRDSSRTIQDVVATDFPGSRQPVLAVETGMQPGLDRVGAKVDGLTGRYLVMMFQPTGPLPATGQADFKDFKDSTAGTDFKDEGPARSVASEAPVGNQPLQIAEITGYGNIPPGTDVAVIPPILPPGGPGSTTTPTGPMPPPISPPGSGVITP